MKMAPEQWREKLVDEVGKRLKKELFKERELSINLVDAKYASIEIVAKVDMIEPTDDLVKEDRYRRDELGPGGEPVVWVKTTGGVVAKAGLQIPIPVDGVSASVGFSTDGFVNCSVVAPYPLSLDESLKAARKAFANLPFSAANATELAQGTEVVLRGYGALAGRASAGVGKQLSLLSGAVAFSAGADVSVGAGWARDISLTVKRLDCALVYVALATGRTVSKRLSAGLGVKIGDADPGLPPSPAEIQKAADALVEKVVDKLEAQILFETTSSSTRTELIAYVIDLSQQKGKEAFADLVRLDARRADALFAEEGPDLGIVRRARLQEQAVEHGKKWQARVFGLEILKSIDSKTRETGHGVFPDGSCYDWWRTALMDGYNGAVRNFFQGKREIQREMIGWRKEGMADVERFYHVTCSVKGDRVTTAADVKRFVAFAGILGGEPDTESESLLGNRTKFGKTDRVIDVYVTREGLATLFGTPPEELMAAYAKVYELLDEPWRNSRKAWRETPWLSRSPDGAKAHACLEYVRRKGGYFLLEEHPYAGDAMGEKKDKTEEYLRLTGRSLVKDSAAYIQSSGLCDMMNELRTSASDSEPKRLFERFAECDHRLGLDFWNELGMLATVVGPEAILISALRITGENGMKIEFAEEGKLVGIRDKLKETIKAMST
jgi:hypothetical protein